LFADPRGGSTWLGQLLQDRPTSALIDEPLWRGFYKSDGSMPSKSSGKLDELKELEFYYYQHIDENDN